MPACAESLRNSHFDMYAIKIHKTKKKWHKIQYALVRNFALLGE